MKQLLTCVALVAGMETIASAQTDIARWTFETTAPAGSSAAGIWITNIAPESGNGTASAWHAGTATYSNPIGNGSEESFTANGWAVGDFFQFVVSTEGLSGIGFSFDQTSSATGPGLFTFSYSLDGMQFTPFGTDYTVSENGDPRAAWNSSTRNPAYTSSFDLSPISAVDNAPAVYFRLTQSTSATAGGSAPSATGSSRLDNVLVVAVPEPSGFALSLIGAGFLGWALHRTRSKRTGN